MSIKLEESSVKEEKHVNITDNVEQIYTLGISTLQKNGLNNQKEASDLAEAVKQTFMKCLQAYSESNR